MSTSSRSQDGSNQFIRPKFDLHSTAARLALRDKGFTNEFTNVISAGVDSEFGMALMDAIEVLGECGNAFSPDDLSAVAELISTGRLPPDEADAGAEAPGTLADAKEAKGSKVASPQTASEFLAFLGDFEKRQACVKTPTGRATHVTGQMVELMLPTTAAATGPQRQFRVLSKRSMW